MERSVSVEDFLGGLLRLNKQAGGGGMGQRTDSEAAFQEFLKRIPSAQNLASQQAGDDKPGHQLFGSNSAANLFPLGSNALGASSQSLGREGNMPRVASLEMLRTFANQQQDHGQDNRQTSNAQAGQHSQLFQQATAGVPNTMAASQNLQHAQPHVQTMPQTQVPGQGQFGSTGIVLPNMGMSMPVPGNSPPLQNMGAQLPGQGVNLLAYQQLQQLQQNPMLASSLQAAAALQLGELGFKIQTSQPQVPEAAEKMEQRRARRMLSNRESARRSRKRKQEQLQDLEGQIHELEAKNDNLESQCQAAAVHVQKLVSEKQRLENENQHLMSIFAQLQKSLGKEKILLHLPAALGGSLNVDPSVAAVDKDNAENSTGSQQESADKNGVPGKSVAAAKDMPSNGDTGQPTAVERDRDNGAEKSAAHDSKRMKVDTANADGKQ